MLAARLIKRKHTDTEDQANEIQGDGMLATADHDGHHNDSKHTGWYRHVDRVYTGMLRFAMGHRWVIVGLCVLVFLSIVPLFMFVGKNFLPVDDQSQFEVSARAPEGYSLGASAQIMERIASRIRQMPGDEGVQRL